jgi:hypothetical protein
MKHLSKSTLSYTPQQREMEEIDLPIEVDWLQ